MNFPQSSFEMFDWPWERFEPYFQALAERPLDAASLPAWLADWSRWSRLLHELFSRLSVAVTVNTEDQQAEKRFNDYLSGVMPRLQEGDHRLKQKLLASGLQPQGYEIALRNMRAEAELFREANLPLLSEEFMLSNEYDKIIAAQTVTWNGKEVTVTQLNPAYQSADRGERERAWRLGMSRRLQDRQAIGELYGRMLTLRRRIAANADMPDYRAYRWKQMQRFDYTPEDCKQFQNAIEQVVVPAASRIYARRRRMLGVDALRPWDLDVDPSGLPPLRPWAQPEELDAKAAAIFLKVDAQLGEHFAVMRREGLLDLHNRKGKAPGGYCTEYPLVERPFIFANAVGIHDDVQTLLHEGGHAFHVFEVASLPYYHQLFPPMEFAEVASMSMELLAAPYLTGEHGGYYTPQDAARARVEHLTRSLLFWPYMAVVDAFQHWVYENPDDAADPASCDACWAELWARFMPGVDWSGLEDEMVTGWQRKQHIHQAPFYYVEYGLALLGAVQVWRKALDDQAGAVAAYRRALALGGTRTLPELFAAAGARFAFDAQTLGEAAALIEKVTGELEAV